MQENKTYNLETQQPRTQSPMNLGVKTQKPRLSEQKTKNLKLNLKLELRNRNGMKQTCFFYNQEKPVKKEKGLVSSGNIFND